MAKAAKHSSVLTFAVIALVLVGLWWLARPQHRDIFTNYQASAHESEAVPGQIGGPSCKSTRCSSPRECAPCKFGQLPFVAVPTCHKFNDVAVM